MRYVTIKMIARHAGKHPVTVVRALKTAGVTVEKCPGVRGVRIPEAAANRFLLKQWPEAGPFPIRAD